MFQILLQFVQQWTPQLWDKLFRPRCTRYNETFATSIRLQEEEAATTSDKEAATTSDKEAATETEVDKLKQVDATEVQQRQQ